MVGSAQRRTPCYGRRFPPPPLEAVVNHKRIAKNTLVLYLRMLVTMGISLYTVRVVLDVLGVEDYGIFHVAGGLVALFTFLPNTMASASQRFFSHALGQKNDERLRRIVGVNAIIYLAIAVITLVSLETLGVWFVIEHLNIPEPRFDAALRLYHLSVVSFVVGILTTPFRSVIIAHEDMQIYAYIAIAEALLRLAAVSVLAYIPGEKLVVYGALLLGITILGAGCYAVICLSRYPECRLKRMYWDKALIKEVVGFTGWTLLGQVTTVARNQAITILLIQYFSPVVVAARVIAVKVANSANLLAQNFNVGLYPPIIKSYAAEDMKGMFALIFNGSKIAFFLMWILALPLLLEMEQIMGLWLGSPPEGAVLFARLALVEALLLAVSLPLATAARAPGRMAAYESILGSIQIGLFAAAWIVLKLGAAAYSVFVVAIVANVVMFLVRLLLLRVLISISVPEFLRRVAVPVAGIVLLSTIPSVIIHLALPVGLISSGVTCLSAFLITACAIYGLGLDKEWRHKLIQMVRSRLLRQTCPP